MMVFDSDCVKELFSANKYRLLKDLFLRKGLPAEARLLGSIAYLQAEGDSDNLAKILDLYIENEVQLGKAYEVLLQGYLFCGYPKAIESFFCLNGTLTKRKLRVSEIFKARPIARNEELLDRGESLARVVHGDKFELIGNRISEICPDLGYLMVAEGYGHILSRGGLDFKSRELAVVASLTSLAANRQLGSHIRGARNVGCTDLEIYETILTGILWLGPEKVRNSIRLLARITGEEYPEPFDFNLL